METILGVLDDSSSVAVRLALSALQLCIHDLLLSVNSDIGLQALLKLLEIRENPYWLVKVSIKVFYTVAQKGWVDPHYGYGNDIEFGFSFFSYDKSAVFGSESKDWFKYIECHKNEEL